MVPRRPLNLPVPSLTMTGEALNGVKVTVTLLVRSKEPSMGPVAFRPAFVVGHSAADWMRQTNRRSRKLGGARSGYSIADVTPPQCILVECSGSACSCRLSSRLLSARAPRSRLWRSPPRSPWHQGPRRHPHRSSLQDAPAPGLWIAAPPQSYLPGSSISLRARSRSSVCASRARGRSHS
jgi:hypothetical protein